MATYFTSDLHFKHKNVIKFAPETRPFSDVDSMEEVLVYKWNRKVKPGDTIYHLGDFCFGSKAHTERIWARLNGNIIKIKGNHDKEGIPYLEIKIGKQHIVLCHYPFVTWNKSRWGAWHLFGHCHGSYEGKGKSLDVGWDAHGKILSFEDIEAIMATKEIHQVDHH